MIDASSVDEALARLRHDSSGYDVLLSDLAMPGQDGFDLIHEVRRSEDQRIRHIPAVAVSAYAREEDRERALAAGFQNHLAKPVTAARLTGTC